MTASTTAADVVEGVDLHGLRAVVTGASSGLGAETARVLAGAGAAVTLAVRNVEAGRSLVSRITGELPDADLRVAELDLADEGSVHAFTGGWTGPLHILVNNAGIMAPPELARTRTGRELQFGTNHIGHFVLATGLHGALARGAEEARPLLGGARVVSVSSRGHLVAGVDLDDPDFERRPYNAFAGYGQSKTANVQFAVEAARRWGGDGILTNAVHPGAIAETNLYRHFPPAREGSAATSSPMGKTVAQGAATSVFAAASPTLAGVSGRYFEDCHEAVVLGPEIENLLAEPEGVAWYALDPDKAAGLWELSERLTTR